jgi:hypothetical protein
MPTGFSGSSPITLPNASPHANRLATRMIFTLTGGLTCAGAGGLGGI